MNESRSLTLELEQLHEFEFRIKFDWPPVEEMLLDEPAPHAPRRLGGSECSAPDRRGGGQLPIVEAAVLIPAGVRVINASGALVFVGGLPAQAMVVPPMAITQSGGPL